MPVATVLVSLVMALGVGYILWPKGDVSSLVHSGECGPMCEAHVEAVKI